MEVKRHSELHMAYFIRNSDMKFEEGIENEALVKNLYGTIKAAVEDEMFRPL